jgi:hypothetical protein
MKLLGPLIIGLAPAAYCLVGAAIEFGDGDRKIAQIEREAQQILRDRDPDKGRLNYYCFGGGGSNIGNWHARYGASMILEATDADGTEHYRIEKWTALEGPDRLDGVMKASFKGINIVSVEIVQPAIAALSCR